MLPVLKILLHNPPNEQVVKAKEYLLYPKEIQSKFVIAFIIKTILVFIM